MRIHLWKYIIGEIIEESHLWVTKTSTPLKISLRNCGTCFRTDVPKMRWYIYPQFLTPHHTGKSSLCFVLIWRNKNFSEVRWEPFPKEQHIYCRRLALTGSILVAHKNGSQGLELISMGLDLLASLGFKGTDHLCFVNIVFSYG